MKTRRQLKNEADSPTETEAKKAQRSLPTASAIIATDTNEGQAAPVKTKSTVVSAKAASRVYQSEKLVDPVGDAKRRKVERQVSSTRSKKLKTNNDGVKHHFSKIRPGYTAPMKLTTPSLEKFQSQGGLESLRKASMKKDYAAALAKSSTSAQSSFSCGGIKSKANNGMLDPSTDPTLAQDLHLLRHRNYLDPKRFYKNPDMPGKWVQRGTYVDTDGRKMRHGTLVDQILGARKESAYVKRKFQTMQRDQQEKKGKKRSRKHKA